MPSVRSALCHICIFCSIHCIAIPVFAQESEGNNNDQQIQLIEEQERQIRMVVILALIPILVSFSFVTFVFYRRKREAFFRQTEAELKLSKAEVEIKALKAQINPHFIFNCMNSIHHYMHKNDIKKAGDYLIKFSQLIRMVLENSSRHTITLKEDLHALTLYIQLEQMRLENRFGFEINVDDDVDQDQCEIPALLIQPFVENAIWHELNKISSNGMLSVHVHKLNDGVQCLIQSKGNGKAEFHTSTALTDGIVKTSMGLSLIRERLELINRMNNGNASFSVKNISDEARDTFGHEVELYIPVNNME